MIQISQLIFEGTVVKLLIELEVCEVVDVEFKKYTIHNSAVSQDTTP